MINRLLFIILLHIIPFNGFTQINVDSLRLELTTHYLPSGTKGYLMEQFQVFKSQNGREEYHLCMDSTGQLISYIDLSIIHKKYDDKNRIILIEGFDSIGKPSYWDFPVKTICTYHSDTTFSEFKTILKNARFKKFINPQGSARIDYEYNLDSKYDIVRYHIYSKDSASLLTFSTCSNGKVCRRSNNVYYELYTISSDKIHYTSNYFFGEDMQLIDGAHSLSFASNWGSGEISINYAYAVFELNPEQEYKQRKITYYSRKRKLVHEADYSSNGLIIDGIIIKEKPKRKTKKKNQKEKITLM